MKRTELYAKLGDLKKKLAALGVSSHDLYFLSCAQKVVDTLHTTIGLEEQDRVRLRRDISLPGPDHGWWCYRKSFVKGAVGRVQSIDVAGTSVGVPLRVYIKFDRMIVVYHSFPDEKPRIVKNDDHVWCFEPEMLERITEEEADAWIKDFDGGEKIDSLGELYLAE